MENQQLADELNVLYCRFEKARLTTSTCSDLHFTHSHNPPTPPASPLPLFPTILPALKVCVEDVTIFRKQNLGKLQDQTVFHLPDLNSVLTNWPQSLHRYSTDLWSCAKFLTASNAPLSFPSPNSPKSLVLTTTDKSLSRLWLWSHLREWSWSTWRTSLDPFWILFSSPTEQTGLWMTLWLQTGGWAAGCLVQS